MLQLNSDAVRFRDALGYNSKVPVDIFRMALSNSEYTIIRIPMTKDFSGMCVIDGNSKIIAINSMMSLGRQRFTLAHELYHVEIEGIKDGRVCTSLLQGSRGESEERADRFASFLLMPYEGLEWFVNKHSISEWTLDAIIEVSQFYQMSFMAVLVRLLQEERISLEQFETWKNVNIRMEATRRGVDVSLYEPSPENEQYASYGEYPRLLEAKKGVMTDSLYLQYLREGFRENTLMIGEEEAWLND